MGEKEQEVFRSSAFTRYDFRTNRYAVTKNKEYGEIEITCNLVLEM